MANNAKDGGQLRFGCTAKELKELMETRGVDAVNGVKYKYGTVDELCRRLHVAPNEGNAAVVIILPGENHPVQAQKNYQKKYKLFSSAPCSVLWPVVINKTIMQQNRPKLNTVETET